MSVAAVGLRCRGVVMATTASCASAGAGLETGGPVAVEGLPKDLVDSLAHQAVGVVGEDKSEGAGGDGVAALDALQGLARAAQEDEDVHAMFLLGMNLWRLASEVHSLDGSASSGGQSGGTVQSGPPTSAAQEQAPSPSSSSSSPRRALEEIRRIKQKAHEERKEYLDRKRMQQEQLQDMNSEDTAVYWLSLACDHGHKQAMVFLANLLLQDSKRSQHTVQQALDLYRGASELPDSETESSMPEYALPVADASWNLGRIYSEGELLPSNPGLAFQFYQRAALLGDPQSIFWVGYWLLTGEGWQVDSVQGLHQTAEGAHAHVDADAEADAEADADAYSEAGGVRDLLELERLDAASVQYSKIAPSATPAIPMLEKALEAGVSAAAYILAQLYRSGDADTGVLPDAARFEHYLDRGVEMENGECLQVLAQCHLQGTDGKTVDVPKAVKLLERSGEAGHSDAFVDLGALYFHGHTDVVPQDRELAFMYYQQAGEMDNMIAWVNLANMYREGHGVPKSETMAKHIRETLKEHIRAELDDRGYGAAEELLQELEETVRVDTYEPRRNDAAGADTNEENKRAT